MLGTHLGWRQGSAGSPHRCWQELLLPRRSLCCPRPAVAPARLWFLWLRLLTRSACAVNLSRWRRRSPGAGWRLTRMRPSPPSWSHRPAFRMWHSWAPGHRRGAQPCWELSTTPSWLQTLPWMAPGVPVLPTPSARCQPQRPLRPLCRPEQPAAGPLQSPTWRPGCRRVLALQTDRWPQTHRVILVPTFYPVE